VTDIIAGGGPVKEEILAECKKHGINIYKTVTIIANQAQWAKKYPDTPMPLQELSTEEKTTLDALKGNSYQEDSGPEYNDSAPPENWQVTEAQKKLIEKAGRENIKAQKDYHWGGEPGKKYLSQWGRNQELLFTDLFCFHHPEVKEFIKSLIAKEMEEQGIKGIAFDFFGYTNYKCCRCAESMRLFNEFREKNNLKPDDTAMNKFSLDTLVEFQNEMADYVKSIRPDAVTLDHVYPVFLPEPLYGNRLKLDYCGQTASWYFYWDPFKIYNYSKVITEEQGKYFPNAKGVTFIGYYSRLDFPYKSPERVELELRSMLKAGSSMVALQ
jgi:hypothetical protein